MIRTKFPDLFNRVMHVSINGYLFQLKVIEEWFGPLYWHELGEDCSSESNFYCEYGDFSLLFNATVEEREKDPGSRGLIEDTRVGGYDGGRWSKLHLLE